MNVGGYAQAVALLDVGKHLQSAFYSGAAERVQRRAVGLIERCFEDDIGAQTAVDANKFAGNAVEQFGVLNDAGPCYENGFLHIG